MTIIRVLAFIPLFKNGLNILRKRKSAGSVNQQEILLFE